MKLQNLKRRITFMIVEVILISFAILMCFSSNFYGMIQMSRSKLYTYYCVLELSEPLKLHDGYGNTIDCYSGEQVKMMGFEEDMIVISSFQHGNEWFPTSERISMSSVKKRDEIKKTYTALHEAKSEQIQQYANRAIIEYAVALVISVTAGFVLSLILRDKTVPHVIAVVVLVLTDLIVSFCLFVIG